MQGAITAQTLYEKNAFPKAFAILWPIFPKLVRRVFSQRTAVRLTLHFIYLTYIIHISEGEDRVSRQQGCESDNLSQPTGRRESANRKARVSQQEGASQPTGRRESANQGGASQTTRSRVRQPGQPGRASDNQVTSQTTGREPANQATSQPTRSRVSQPGRESDNRSRVSQQVTSQPTRSRVSQPGRESDNQDARRTRKETQ